MARASLLTILASVFILTITFDASVFASVNSNPYVDSNNQFSINPPSGWTVDSSGAYGTAVILYGPTDSNFRINMNIIVGATSLSLSDYVSTTKSQLSTGLTNYQLVSETSTTIGGLAAYELVNTFTQGSYSIEDKQDILVQNQKAYVITSTALQTNYATYQPAFDESVQTFKLTASAFPWTIVIIGAVIAGGLAVGLAIFFVRRKSHVNIPPMMPQPPPSTSPS
jgi:DcrB-like protein